MAPRPVTSSRSRTESSASMARRPFHVSADRVQPQTQPPMGAGSCRLSRSYVSSSASSSPGEGGIRRGGCTLLGTAGGACVWAGMEAQEGVVLGDGAAGRGRADEFVVGKPFFETERGFVAALMLARGGKPSRG